MRLSLFSCFRSQVTDSSNHAPNRIVEPSFSMLKPGYAPGSPMYLGHYHDDISSDNDRDSDISSLTDYSDTEYELFSTLAFVNDEAEGDNTTVLSLESNDVICLTRQPGI